MEPKRALPPMFIGTGTLTQPHDMVRALETIESFSYRYVVDGVEMSSGRATLVRIMLDTASASALVNGCLFLNVSSLRYLNFSTDSEKQTRFELHTDGAVLEMTPLDEPELRIEQRQAIRLMEKATFDSTTYVSLDEEDDED